MNKINVAIVENYKNLSDNDMQIRSAIKTANAFAFPRLKIDWDVDVVMRNVEQRYADAKDHVSGHTYESVFIVLKV